MPKTSAYRQGDKFSPFNYDKIRKNLTDIMLGILPYREALILKNLMYYSSERGIAYPSHDTVAKKSGVSTRHVRRLLTNLVDKGYIEKTYNTHDKRTYIYFKWQNIYCEILGIGPKKIKPVKTKEEKRLEDLRKEWLEEVREAYHPEKASLQPTRTKEYYNQALVKAGENARSRADRRKRQRDEHERILAEIERLKQTKDWTRQGGKYLQGLGNFLAGGSWKLDVPDAGDAELADTHKLIEDMFK